MKRQLKKFTARRKATPEPINQVLEPTELEIKISQIDINDFMKLFDTLTLNNFQEEALKFEYSFDTQYLQSVKSKRDEELDASFLNLLYAKELIVYFIQVVEKSQQNQEIKAHYLASINKFEDILKGYFARIFKYRSLKNKLSELFEIDFVNSQVSKVYNEIIFGANPDDNKASELSSHLNQIIYRILERESVKTNSETMIYEYPIQKMFFEESGTSEISSIQNYALLCSELHKRIDKMPGYQRTSVGLLRKSKNVPDKYPTDVFEQVKSALRDSINGSMKKFVDLLLSRDIIRAKDTNHGNIQVLTNGKSVHVQDVIGELLFVIKNQKDPHVYSSSSELLLKALFEQDSAPDILFTQERSRIVSYMSSLAELSKLYEIDLTSVIDRLSSILASMALPERQRKRARREYQTAVSHAITALEPPSKVQKPNEKNGVVLNNLEKYLNKFPIPMQNSPQTKAIIKDFISELSQNTPLEIFVHDYLQHLYKIYPDIDLKIFINLSRRDHIPILVTFASEFFDQYNSIYGLPFTGTVLNTTKEQLESWILDKTPDNGILFKKCGKYIYTAIKNGTLKYNSRGILEPVSGIHEHDMVMQELRQSMIDSLSLPKQQKKQECKHLQLESKLNRFRHDFDTSSADKAAQSEIKRLEIELAKCAIITSGTTVCGSCGIVMSRILSEGPETFESGQEQRLYDQLSNAFEHGRIEAQQQERDAVIEHYLSENLKQYKIAIVDLTNKLESEYNSELPTEISETDYTILKESISRLIGQNTYLIENLYNKSKGQNVQHKDQVSLDIVKWIIVAIVSYRYRGENNPKIIQLNYTNLGPFKKTLLHSQKSMIDCYNLAIGMLNDYSNEYNFIKDETIVPESIQTEPKIVISDHTFRKFQERTEKWLHSEYDNSVIMDLDQLLLLSKSQPHIGRKAKISAQEYLKVYKHFMTKDPTKIDMGSDKALLIEILNDRIEELKFQSQTRTMLVDCIKVKEAIDYQNSVLAINKVIVRENGILRVLDIDVSKLLNKYLGHSVRLSNVEKLFNNYQFGNYIEYIKNFISPVHKHKEEYLELKQLQKKLSGYGRIQYICTSCDFNHRNMITAQLHAESHGNNKPIIRITLPLSDMECPYCDHHKTTPDREYFIKHILTSHKSIDALNINRQNPVDIRYEAHLKNLDQTLEFSFGKIIPRTVELQDNQVSLERASVLDYYYNQSEIYQKYCSHDSLYGLKKHIFVDNVCSKCHLTLHDITNASFDFTDESVQGLIDTVNENVKMIFRDYNLGAEPLFMKQKAQNQLFRDYYYYLPKSRSWEIKRQLKGELSISIINPIIERIELYYLSVRKYSQVDDVEFYSKSLSEIDILADKVIETCKKNQKIQATSLLQDYEKQYSGLSTDTKKFLFHDKTIYELLDKVEYASIVDNGLEHKRARTELNNSIGFKAIELLQSYSIGTSSLTEFGIRTNVKITSPEIPRMLFRQLTKLSNQEPRCYRTVDYK